MIIKLLEQPIIAINEAEVVGSVDGLILKDGKALGIYHRNMDECHFAIPVENAIIGPDAVMIRDVSDMTLASKNAKPLRSMLQVYNLGGKLIGYLNAVEAEDDYTISCIYTEDYKIDISKIVSYESVIITDADAEELEANQTPYVFRSGFETEIEKIKEEVESNLDCSVAIPAKSVDTSAPEAAPEERAEAESSCGPECSAEEDASPCTAEPAAEVREAWEPQDPEAAPGAGEVAAAAEEAEDPAPRAEEDKAVEEFEFGEHSIVRPLHHNDGRDEKPSLDSKYAYLCGKQLVEEIEINGSFYGKGHIIDSNLIRLAIENNSIVKVIMNAEE